MFEDWLLDFDEYISRFRERRVVLIIDIAWCDK